MSGKVALIFLRMKCHFNISYVLDTLLVMFIFRQVAEKMKKKRNIEAQTVPSTQRTSDEGEQKQTGTDELQASLLY